MILIGLFCFASFLFFIGGEPFKAAGVFLSICYLPGLFFTALIKRGKLFFEDLILSFPYSVGISSVLTLGLLFMGVHVAYIPILIHMIVGAAAIIYVISVRREKARAVIDISKKHLTFCLFAFLMTLLLSIPFFLGLNRGAIAGHAFHHSLMVTQILNGIFPPENPGLGGSPIGYYWGFHGLIAAITSQTKLHQLQIIFIINVLSLFTIFCIAYIFAKIYNLSETYCYILPVAILGLMRFDAGILFIFNLFSGKLKSLEEISSPFVEPFNYMENWLQGIAWFDSRLFYLRKFYNVSGMPLAISLCFSYLLLLKLTLKKGFAENKSYFIGIGIVIAACFLSYPPLAIFILFYAPVWTLVILLSSKGNIRERIIEALRTALPFIAACFVIAPYMLYIMASRDVSSSGQGRIFTLSLYDQSVKNIIVFLVPLPVIIYGVWIAYKKLSSSRELAFLLTGAASCLFLAVFTRWPFDNSYKFNYILTFYLAFFFVLVVSHLQHALKGNKVKLLLTACAVILLLINPVMIEASYLVSYLFVDYKYTFSGGHIEFTRDKSRNEAYAWIRENTPGNALLMLTYTETNWPCCGLNNNYESAAIAERTLYVIKDKDYTLSDPEYLIRIMIREKLFKNPEEKSVNDFFLSLKRPVYLLVEDGLDETIYFVEDKFAKFSDSRERGFVLVFKNEKQRVYLIRTNE